MALSSQSKLSDSNIFISGNSSFYKCQMPMENIKIGKNKRRNLFAEMAKVGEVLTREGRLSISHIQRYLACGYTHATKIIDYLESIDELYQLKPGVFLSARLYTPPKAEKYFSPSDKRNIARVFKSAKNNDAQ